MHSDLYILGTSIPLKYPSFPTLEDSLTLRYPTVKSMRGTRLESRCVRADSNGGLHEEER
jgi:hypothetical protein